MAKLNIWHYFLLMKNMKECLIKLDIIIIMLISNISDVYSHKYLKTKMIFYLKFRLNMHKVVTNIKSVFNKNCNCHYYQGYLEKWSYR